MILNAMKQLYNPAEVLRRAKRLYHLSLLETFKYVLGLISQTAILIFFLFMTFTSLVEISMKIISYDALVYGLSVLLTVVIGMIIIASTRHFLSTIAGIIFVSTVFFGLCILNAKLDDPSFVFDSYNLPLGVGITLLPALFMFPMYLLASAGWYGAAALFVDVLDDGSHKPQSLNDKALRHDLSDVADPVTRITLRLD